MLLRRIPRAFGTEFHYVRDMNLNTIRLEGKMESDDFYDLADEKGVLVMAGWCCCDLLGTVEEMEAGRSGNCDRIVALANHCALRSHPSVVVWLNGSDVPPPANVESAYI